MWFKLFSQLSIGVVIILSGGVAGIYYVLKYDKGSNITEEINNLETQKQTAQQKVENLKGELNRLQDMDKAMNLMGDEINKFLKFIPDKVSSSMILNHLNEKARTSGVELENIVNHRVSEKKEFYEKLKVSVTVRGLFTQILIFLSKLTSLTEIITVESFTMEEMAQKGRREVKMRMDIYGYRYITPIIVTQEQEISNKGG